MFAFLEALIYDFKKPIKKSRYKLDTGLWAVNEYPEFSSDKEAWENLRLLLPNKYATLYKEVEVNVNINNKKSYIERFNEKYTLSKIDGDKPHTHKMWVPIMDGITSDEYKL